MIRLINIVIFVLGIFLIVTLQPAHAEEPLIADGPYLGMGVMVATMFGCSQLSPADLGSHCYGGFVPAVWTTIFTKNKWYGAAAGCGLGAYKEWGYDPHNGGVTSTDDFIATCAGALLGAYAMDNIITFYKEKERVGIRVKLAFSTGQY